MVEIAKWRNCEMGESEMAKLRNGESGMAKLRNCEMAEARHDDAAS
jgi:hypothetical protein